MRAFSNMCASSALFYHPLLFSSVKMGRTKGARDSKPRTRRKKTDAEKKATKNQTLADASAGTSNLRSLFQPVQQAEAESLPEPINVQGNDADPSDDEPEEALPPNVDEPLAAAEEHTSVFSEEVEYRADDDAEEIAANLNMPEGGNGELDDEINAEPDDTPAPTKLDVGIQQEYLRAVHDGLRAQVREDWPALKSKWMLDHLKDNDFWIKKEQALSIARKLKRDGAELDLHHPAYYRSIKFWIPEMMYDGCMPFCPTCKSDEHVKSHGFNSKHIGRQIVGLTENYYIITKRYKCTACEKTKNEMQKEADKNHPGANIKIKHKYTFMGWDPESLPLMADGRGDEFPAYLTWKAGLDMTLIDMMRALFDKGVRHNAFADMVLELHAKTYTKAYLRYERDITVKLRKQEMAGFISETSHEMFSSFNEIEKYNAKVPTAGYFATAYKKFAATLQTHFAKEVKKRGAKTLAVDVSYKEAKHLSQYRGNSIFKGLFTGTNEFGEVRVQHHVVSDAHDQMKPSMEAFKKTTEEYGLPQPDLVSTDDPTRDYNFFLNLLDSLKDQQAKFNEGRAAAASDLDPYPYDPENPFIEIKEKVKDMNLAVAAMLHCMDKEKGLA